MTIRTGTSGFSYKEWKGPFYPEDLPAARFLEFYASKLPAVEINNTFYRMPRASVLEGWAEKVPDHFRFILKASRRITHFKRLKEAKEEVDYFLKNAAPLGEKLGAVLFQLPPNFRKDVDRLSAFLDVVDASIPAAFEFRHASWVDDEVFGLLRDAGRAVCVADGEDGIEMPVVETCSWGYLRLRRPGYSDDDLAEWARRVSETSWEHAFVFFKHEDEGAGPAMAARFLEVAGSVA